MQIFCCGDFRGWESYDGEAIGLNLRPGSGAE